MNQPWSRIRSLLIVAGAFWFVYAGCCKTLPQRHRICKIQSSRAAGTEGVAGAVTVALTLDGMIQGPPGPGVTEAKMYGAIQIPDSWSGVSVSYSGHATAKVGTTVVANFDSNDLEAAQAQLAELGIAYEGSELPAWNPDAAVAAAAELAEPAQAGYQWVGFSSDSFPLSMVPASLHEARIEGSATTQITIANAPAVGPVQLVIRGGDLAEGLDTVRVPVLLDAYNINYNVGGSSYQTIGACSATPVPIEPLPRN